MSTPAVIVVAISAFSAASLGASPPAPARVAAIGDSLTDEYAEQTYGAYARSWTQILVHAGRIDMGPTAAQAGRPNGDWGEPRRTGYKHNWARYAETTDWGIASGQPAGAAASAASGEAEFVFIWLGGNDFSTGAYATYDRIYYNQWTPQQTEEFVAQRIVNLRSIVQVVHAAGGRIVLCSISDFSFMPWIWGVRPSVQDRERVSQVLANVRDRTRALAREYRVVFLDMYRLNKDLFGANPAQRPMILVGNVPIRLHGSGEQPDVGFVFDLVHPQTIVQAVWAGAMLEALRSGYGAPVQEFTERNMVEAAGLTYGGGDTLSAVLRPLRNYVQDFSCPGDFDVDGQVGIQDVFEFLAAYFVADTRADVDGDSAVTLADVFGYLAEYFTGCT